MHATYDLQKDGTVTASVGGKVIASGPDLATVEGEVKEALDAPKKVAADQATHITTPNGLTGQILSRVATTWGDAYSVRFENGEIQSLYVTAESEFTQQQPKKVASGTTPIQRLASVAEEHVGPDRVSLKARLAELTNLRVEAKTLIQSGVSLEDMHALDGIIVQAEHEQIQIKQALDHLDATEGEGFTPYKPDMQVIPGANVGHQNDGTWLDAVIEDDRKAAASVDFNSLLDDGPTLLVASQEDATLADAGDMRDRALSFVQSKTSGFAGDKVDEFERLFLDRTEQARRVELAARKQIVKKEAAQKKSNVDDAPVESLFM